MAWLNTAWIESLGLTLLHFVWQGALIGLAYALVLWVVRPSSASARYNLAVGTLLLLGLAPVLTLIHLTLQSGTSETAVGAAGAWTLIEVVAGTDGHQAASNWLFWTVAAWLAGVVVLSARLALGWHYIHQLRRSAEHATVAHLQPVLERLCQTMVVRRSVALASSARVRSPVVVGWLKPLILLPPALSARLSIEQLEMILAHELAHIRRHDHLVNLVQTVIETLFFYHPVVALVSRRIRIERENACDDLAVAATRNRLAYVEMLATLEHLRQPGPRLALGMQDGQILGRIRRLVERAQPKRQLGLTLPALLVMTLGAGLTGLSLLPEAEPEVLEIEAVTRAPAAVEAPAEAASNRSLAESRPLFGLPSANQLRFESPEPVAEPAPETVLDPARDREMTRAATDEVREDRSIAETTAVTTVERSEEAAIDMPSETLAASDTQAAAAQDAPLQVAMARPNPAPLEPRTEPEPPISLEPPPLTGGELRQRVEPDFPRSARRRGVNGLVELEFLVDSRGRVQDIDVIDERPLGWDFGEAAQEAIAQWRFEPYRRGEAAVERRVRVEVEFDLAQACEISTGSRLPRC
ncbi:M56 family metallopeptidase [Wenzhouxiangella marina]|uniref:Protein TonB n=1 Tax=Wenzhouxiangella marina TaxID=1579979 RepID=A0A0K0Y064_9GAMM|nr:M56 family metallopeptidase [Wenzhouxiangella marina]AKS43305.1 hypothetical protein WM2015_2951 [Wenzhouxiangella marina]MBB6087004.1 TonB family protein [Wenzhouxiangella marina]